MEKTPRLETKQVFLRLLTHLFIATMGAHAVAESTTNSKTATMAPLAPKNWPDSLEYVADSCVARSTSRVGMDVVNPTFINVSFDCDGQTSTTSMFQSKTDTQGGIQFTFYNSARKTSCQGNAKYNPEKDAYVGTSHCSNSEGYSVTIRSIANQ